MAQPDTIKQYIIRRKLGHGAMGMVFEAEDTLLKRTVAIKLMHRHLAEDATQTARFMREASSAAILQHPNIITIYETGSIDDTHFIAMEYVAGKSVQDLLDSNTSISLQLALDISCQVLAGLHAAHGKGILHRDIKPENILLSENNLVRIADFGIAKVSSQMGLTREQDILGTVEYMPPEQMLGDELDGRSDLYSVAIMTYQLLTGRVPFTGDNAVEVLYKQLNEHPRPPSFYNKSLTRAVDMVLFKALQKDKNLRWENAPAFAAALSDAFEGGNAAMEVVEGDSSRSGMGGRVASPGSGQPFVGREKEFEALLQLYGQASSGSGRIAIITGPAGIGKTALVRHFAIMACDSDTWVLSGACLYQDGLDAYRPFLDALKAFFREAVFLLGPEQREALTSIIHEKIPVLSDFIHYVHAGGAAKAPFASQQRVASENILEGMDYLFSLLSTIKPVVFILDDLQWADEATLRLFHYLARNSDHNRILMVGLCRSMPGSNGDTEAQQNVRETILRLRRETSCSFLDIAALSAAESDSLIDALYPDNLFHEALYKALYERTHGNPLVHLEILDKLVESGQLFRKNDRWQEKPGEISFEVSDLLEEAFLRQLDKASDDERELLQIAAVTGFRIDIGILAGLTELSRIKLLKILQRLEQQLHILKSGESGLQFEHPVYRDILYREIPLLLRKEYHALIADLYAERPAAEVKEISRKIARHYLESGHIKQAVPLLLQAGERAFRLMAWREASLIFGKLLSLLDENHLALPEQKQLPEVLCMLGECYEELGKRQESLSVFEQYKIRSRELQFPDGEVDAYLKIGRVHDLLGNWEAAMENYQTCRELAAERGSEAILRTVLNNIGIVHFQTGDFKQAVNFFEMNTGEAATAPDKDRANSLASLGIISSIRADYQAALDYYQSALKIYRQLQLRKNQAQVYHNMGMTYADLGETEQSLHAYSVCLNLVQDFESEQLRALTFLNMAKLYARLGDKETAVPLLAKAQKIFLRSEDVLSIGEVKLVSGLLHLNSKEFAQAAENIGESMRINREMKFPEGLAEGYCTWGDLKCAQTEYEEAIASYKKAMDIYRDLNSEQKVDQLSDRIRAVANQLETS